MYRLIGGWAWVYFGLMFQACMTFFIFSAALPGALGRMGGQAKRTNRLLEDLSLKAGTGR